MTQRPEESRAEAFAPPVVKSSVVATTLAILRLLGERHQALGVNAIARALSLAPSSCFKILKHLQADDFVDFDPLTKGYSLGVGAIGLARSALDPRSTFKTIRPRLEEIAATYSMALGFWRRVPRSRIVLAGYIEGGSAMRIHMSVGQRLPMLVGGVGRAIAAELQLSDAELRREFDHLRWQVPLPFEDYLHQVREAADQGYAVDRNNFSIGVTTVAVAIRNVDGDVRYGVSGIVFTGQHDAGSIARAGAEFVALAKWASPRLIGT